MLQRNIHILPNCCVATDLNVSNVSWLFLSTDRLISSRMDRHRSEWMGTSRTSGTGCIPTIVQSSKYLFSGSSTSGSISGGSTSGGSSGGSTSGGSSGGTSGGSSSGGSSGGSSSSSHHNDGHHSRPDNVELMPCRTDQKGYRVDEHLQQYWCQEPTRDKDGKIIDGEYNEGTGYWSGYNQGTGWSVYNQGTGWSGYNQGTNSHYRGTEWSSYNEGLKVYTWWSVYNRGTWWLLNNQGTG